MVGQRATGKKKRKMVVSLCSELKQHAQVFDYLNFDSMSTLEIKLWDAEFTTIHYAHTIFHQSNIC